MYLLSGLLLFDNLCVLWWYADSTRRQMEATEQEVYENRLARWRDNKPIVFLELAEFVGAEDDPHHRAAPWRGRPHAVRAPCRRLVADAR
jgi:hypothetical protein